MYTNPRWSEITGIPAADALGQDWDIIVGAKQMPEAVDDPSADISRRLEILVPGSAPRVVLVNAKSIPDANGAVAGWVGTVADVTAEARAEQAMSRRDTALSATAMQKAFATSASHELRTPTTAILGFVEEVLENDALADEDRGFLRSCTERASVSIS